MVSSEFGSISSADAAMSSSSFWDFFSGSLSFSWWFSLLLDSSNWLPILLKTIWREIENGIQSNCGILNLEYALSSPKKSNPIKTITNYGSKVFITESTGADKVRFYEKCFFFKRKYQDWTYRMVNLEWTILLNSVMNLFVIIIQLSKVKVKLIFKMFTEKSNPKQVLIVYYWCANDGSDEIKLYLKFRFMCIYLFCCLHLSLSCIESDHELAWAMSDTWKWKFKSIVVKLKYRR